jgi:serine/threonine protein kinase
VALSLEKIEGKYEILEKISEGGMGAVYKVRHRYLEEIRVVKVIRPHLASMAELKRRFVREAKLASRLRHPNIAQLYDFAIEEGANAYLVMEYIEGITLQEALESAGAPAIGLSLEIACQSLAAIEYLHRKGIVHRDISPDNIMIGKADDGGCEVKLIDLGIAKAIEADGGLTATGMFIGKVRYASPEHIKAQEGVQINERSDIYSFGVVLYELLTGTHPIPSAGVSALIAAHLFQPPTPFEKTDPEGRVSAELREIILKALSKEPEQRFVSAKELAEALDGQRDANPYPDGELDRILASRKKAADSAATVGTTQDRLDQQFGPWQTPKPATGTHELGFPTEVRSQPPQAVATPPPFTEPVAGQSPQQSAPPAGVTRPRGVAKTVEATAPGEAVGTRRLTSPPVALTEGVTAAVLDSVVVAEPLRVETARQGRRRSRLGWIGVAAAVAIVAAAVVGMLTLRGGVPEAGPGVVLLDAVPWAEVTSVLDAAGQPVQCRLPSSTPLRLALPCGTYTVTFRRGEDGPEKVVQVEVEAEHTRRQVVTFEETDPEELVRSFGL